MICNLCFALIRIVLVGACLCLLCRCNWLCSREFIELSFCNGLTVTVECCTEFN